MDRPFVPAAGFLPVAGSRLEFRLRNLGTGDDGFGPEQLLAWEIRANFRSADEPWTLRASAFLYDIDDRQVHTTVPLPDRVVTAIENAGSRRNLLDADYCNQIFLQSSPGYPSTWKVGFGLRL